MAINTCPYQISEYWFGWYTLRQAKLLNRCSTMADEKKVLHCTNAACAQNWPWMWPRKPLEDVIQIITLLCNVFRHEKTLTILKRITGNDEEEFIYPKIVSTATIHPSVAFSILPENETSLSFLNDTEDCLGGCFLGKSLLIKNHWTFINKHLFYSINELMIVMKILHVLPTFYPNHFSFPESFQREWSDLCRKEIYKCAMRSGWHLNDVTLWCPKQLISHNIKHIVQIENMERNSTITKSKT